MISTIRFAATVSAAGAAALLVPWSGPGAGASGQSIEFIIDDGASEQGWGSVCIPEFDVTVPWAWVNRFENEAGAAIRIVRLEIAFGANEVKDDQSSIGDAVSGLIYVDPAATGDPLQAQLAAAWALPGGVHALDGETFATHDVPGAGVIIEPGAEFYLGVGDEQSSLDDLAHLLAAADTGKPAGQSFGLWFGECPEPQFNPYNIVDVFDVPIVNWLVRGEAYLAADLDRDGSVDAADLATLLSEWGECAGCDSDFDGDGSTGAADLAVLLSSWT
jgi:hypothetical protein